MAGGCRVLGADCWLLVERWDLLRIAAFQATEHERMTELIMLVEL